MKKIFLFFIVSSPSGLCVKKKSQTISEENSIKHYDRHSDTETSYGESDSENSQNTEFSESSAVQEKKDNKYLIEIREKKEKIGKELIDFVKNKYPDLFKTIQLGKKLFFDEKTKKVSISHNKEAIMEMCLHYFNICQSNLENPNIYHLSKVIKIPYKKLRVFFKKRLASKDPEMIEIDNRFEGFFSKTKADYKTKKNDCINKTLNIVKEIDLKLFDKNKSNELSYIEENQEKIVTLSLKFFQMIHDYPRSIKVSTLANILQISHSNFYNFFTEKFKEKNEKVMQIDKITGGIFSKTKVHYKTKKNDCINKTLNIVKEINLELFDENKLNELSYIKENQEKILTLSLKFFQMIHDYPRSIKVSTLANILQIPDSNLYNFFIEKFKQKNKKVMQIDKITDGIFSKSKEMNAKKTVYFRTKLNFTSENKKPEHIISMTEDLRKRKEDAENKLLSFIKKDFPIEYGKITLCENPFNNEELGYTSNNEKFIIKNFLHYTEICENYSFKISFSHFSRIIQIPRTTVRSFILKKYKEKDDSIVEICNKADFFSKSEKMNPEEDACSESSIKEKKISFNEVLKNKKDETEIELLKNIENEYPKEYKKIREGQNPFNHKHRGYINDNQQFITKILAHYRKICENKSFKASLTHFAEIIKIPRSSLDLFIKKENKKHASIDKR